MKYIVPNYYKAFHCIAGRCRHSCCTGWEIDIDKPTHTLYQGISGTFGARLSESIEIDGGNAYFRLDAQERCPFLNRENLCDIILTLGEDALCQICRDHPRFRSFFSDRTEIGLGLCCEAAGELLLGSVEKMHLVPLEGTENAADTNLTEAEQRFFAFREQVFAVLQNRAQRIDARLQAVLTLCRTALPQKTPAQWASFFLQLERLDDAWTQNLQELQTASTVDLSLALPGETDIFFEQLAVYFIYRHLASALEDGALSARAAFSVLSVQIISYLCQLYFGKHGILPLAAVVEIARLYSSEIEYSQENMDTLLAILHGERADFAGDL